MLTQKRNADKKSLLVKLWLSKSSRFYHFSKEAIVGEAVGMQVPISTGKQPRAQMQIQMDSILG